MITSPQDLICLSSRIWIITVARALYEFSFSTGGSSIRSISSSSFTYEFSNQAGEFFASRINVTNMPVATKTIVIVMPNSRCRYNIYPGNTGTNSSNMMPVKMQVIEMDGCKVTSSCNKIPITKGMSKRTRGTLLKNPAPCRTIQFTQE